jgi:hypothetical protein
VILYVATAAVAAINSARVGVFGRYERDRMEPGQLSLRWRGCWRSGLTLADVVLRTRRATGPWI